MPCLSDLPAAVRRHGLWVFTKRIASRINRHRLAVWASALAYSWLFAVFPFLLFLLALLAYLPMDRAAVMREVEDAVRGAFPHDAAQAIVAEAAVLLNQHKRRILSVSIVVALWAASGGMSTVMSALDRCNGVRQERERPVYIQRPLAILLTLVVTTLILVVLALLPLGSIAQAWAEHQAGARWLNQHGVHLSGGMVLAAEAARWTVSILLMLMLLAVMYHFGPTTRRRFRYLTPGGVFAVGMWIILGLALRVYVSHFADYSATYGTLGGAVVLLLVFYLDGLALLVGAELNSEIDEVVTEFGPDAARSEEKDVRGRPNGL